jgi:hypothetical protein
VTDRNSGAVRREWRGTARGWGPHGNERLTSSTALVLLLLLALETLTTLSLRSFLSVHIFLGLLLLPPVALKLASTGWRFVRYYSGSVAYRLHGAPRLLLRLLGPLLVASTVSLLASGVALITIGHGGGTPLTLHVVSFVVWGVLMIVHVLAYLARTVRDGAADWRRSAAPVSGVGPRRLAVGSALVAGVILASATYPAQHAWLNHRRGATKERGTHEGAGRAPGLILLSRGRRPDVALTLPARGQGRAPREPKPPVSTG